MAAGDVTVSSTAPLQISTEVDILRAAARDRPDDLINMLAKSHPAYLGNISLWQATGDISLGRINSDPDKKRYLIQGDVEENPHYDKRVSLSSFLPETPSLLSDFIGAVFSKPARREFKKLEEVEDLKPGEQVNFTMIQDRINEFINDAGLEGQPLTRIAEDGARQALVFGSVDAVLDHPPLENEDDEGTAIPRTILYSPEQRLDWQEGEDGNFIWVKYLERVTVQSDWVAGREFVDEYRIFTAPQDGQKGMIFLFRVKHVEEKGKKKQQVEVLEPVEHNFPSIPVRTLYWHKLAGGVGDPWVRPMVDGDIKAFRQESDVTWDIFVHAHPWILAWLHRNGVDDNPLKRIRLGANWAQHLDPGDEERKMENLEYLAPNTAELSLQIEAAEKTREMVRRLAGNGSNLDKVATTPESGVAIAYRQAQRSKNFKQLARGLQEWEWQILELVINEGREELFDIQSALEIQYPDKFDQRLVDELEADLKTADMIGSPTLKKEISKQLAVRILGDGATQDVIEEVQAEIESAADKPVAEEAEAPPQMTGILEQLTARK